MPFSYQWSEYQINQQKNCNLCGQFDSMIKYYYIINTFIHRKNVDGLFLVQFVDFSEFRHCLFESDMIQIGHRTFKTKSWNDIA